MQIALDTNAIADIPVRTMAPHAAQRLLAVFYVPGFGGNKEAGLSLGYR